MSHAHQTSKPLVKFFGRLSFPRLSCPDHREHLRFVAVSYSHLLPNGQYTYEDLCEQIKKAYDTEGESAESAKHRSNITFLQAIDSTSKA